MNPQPAVLETAAPPWLERKNLGGESGKRGGGYGRGGADQDWRATASKLDKASPWSMFAGRSLRAMNTIVSDPAGGVNELSDVRLIDFQARAEPAPEGSGGIGERLFSMM